MILIEAIGLLAFGICLCLATGLALYDEWRPVARLLSLRDILSSVRLFLRARIIWKCILLLFGIIALSFVYLLDLPSPPRDGFPAFFERWWNTPVGIALRLLMATSLPVMILSFFLYPPLVLYLANSSPRALQFHSILSFSCKSHFRIVSFLNSKTVRMTWRERIWWTFAEGERHRSNLFRTRESGNWIEAVDTAIQITPVIIVDCRDELTGFVSIELELLAKRSAWHKVLLVGDETSRSCFVSCIEVDEIRAAIESAPLYDEGNIMRVVRSRIETPPARERKEAGEE